MSDIFKDPKFKKMWGDFQRWQKTAPKPCYCLNFCPYGNLVEQFELKEKEDKYSCSVFGHQCPFYQVAEPFSEEMWK